MEIKKQDLNEWQATLVELKGRIDDLYATLEHRLDVNNEAKELVQIQHWEVLSHLTQPFMSLDQIHSQIAYLAGLMSEAEEKQQPHLTVHKSTKEMN
jgi:septation ring formation regulator EzrA